MAWHHSDPAHTPPAFSREWWIGGLRNLIWVALVTVLIWVYADMEFIDTATISSVTLNLNTDSKPRLTLLSPSEHTITFEVSGSQASIERLRSQIEAAGSTITCDVSRNYDAGQNTVSIAELLAQADDIDLRGIAVESSEPDDITLELDPLMTIKDVPVELQWTGAKLSGEPAPQTATISVSKSLWEQAKMANPKLQTQVIDLSRSPVGTQTLRAQINPLIGNLRVQPQPPSVTFEVQIVKTVDSADIPTTVQVLCPSAWGEPGDTTWQEYELRRAEASDSDWRPELTIVGPSRNLLPENVTAYIQLTEDDKSFVSSWLTQEVKVVFKPGTDLQLQGPPPTVRYKMQKRSAAPPGSGSP